MQATKTYNPGVARARMNAKTISTTGEVIQLRSPEVSKAGIVGLTIKTDKDIYYAKPNDTIGKSTTAGTLQIGAKISAGTKTIQWDFSSIQIAAASDSASVEILEIFYDDLNLG